VSIHPPRLVSGLRIGKKALWRRYCLALLHGLGLMFERVVDKTNNLLSVLKDEG
jgi:hypothetical protein